MKQTIHEQCQLCGKRAARKIGDEAIVLLAHKCPEGPPGPSDPPRRVRFDSEEIEFVPGDFPVDHLRAELDEAWAIIDDLRSKRFEAERRVKQAVEAAMREVYR